MLSYFAFLTNLLFYNCTKIITVTARGFYSEGAEMYQITLDLEQKPAMLEHFFPQRKQLSHVLYILEELCDTRQDH